METDERPAADPVIQDLLDHPQGYNLFQAIYLLERAAARHHRSESGWTPVRLRARVTLAFSPSDVSRAQNGPTAREAFTLETPAMALVGVGGPMPMPFTELVLARNAVRDYATADFLNIFHHRLIELWFRGRKKHHVALNGTAPHDSPLAACLDALSALGHRAGLTASDGQVGWLEHAGLMGGAPRSLAGLLALLSHRLGVRTGGEQFCGGWRTLERQDVQTLGARRTRLGLGAVLGQRVWDQSAGIRIDLRELSRERLSSMLRGGADFSVLQWLVRRYLAQDVEVEIALHPQIDSVNPPRLGAAGGLRLGWTSWIGASVRPARYWLDPMSEAAGGH